MVIHLNTGEKELLITTLLDKKKYPRNLFKELYGKRWGAEENYKWHKVGFELENFSCQSALGVEQELFSTVFTANMASLLMQEAEKEIKEENKEKSLKYAYKINKRVAIAILKEQLLNGILGLETDMEALCEKLKNDLKRNLCPIRPNRSFSRPKKGRLKFGCTMRRSI